MTTRTIFVDIELGGKNHRVGILRSHLRSRAETSQFEYGTQWLENPDRFELAPALALAEGPQFSLGAIGDSAPDRWGRELMRHAERRQAKQEGRQARTLTELDYLLRVDDELRQGALRFSEQEDGPYLAVRVGMPIPPLVDLPRLLAATRRVEDAQDTDEDLKLLLAPGSSQGGARPKSAVRHPDGRLAIAKFSPKQQDHPVELWEAVALDLAGRAGIRVPNWQIVKVAGRAVLVTDRFDRAPDRVPFLSSASMLAAKDGERRSYLEIATALRRHGADTRRDLRELWRRIVFTVLVSNVDDHLRNHAFLYTGPEGWELSPAYDLNPTPIDIKSRVLSTSITADDDTASLELALSVARHFDLDLPAARAIAHEVGTVVGAWRAIGRRVGLKSAQLDRMESAFDHEDLRAAQCAPVAVAGNIPAVPHR